MYRTARISSAGTAMLLPAEDAYDRELVFEEAEFAARHHGTAGLTIGSMEMRVSSSDAKPGVPCTTCGAPIRIVSYLLGRRRLCIACAKHAISC